MIADAATVTGSIGVFTLLPGRTLGQLKPPELPLSPERMVKLLDQVLVSLREAHALMRRFRISGVPIVDGEGRLIGIITNRDLQFESNLDRTIADAMTKDRLVTAPVAIS